MIEVDRSQICLQAQPASKEAAIRQVGQLLVETGYIEAGYVDSMLGRELVANTYLGNGIAIPHGLPKDRDLIKRTGIAVLQVPEGVTWNPGETAYLIVGIAARSDEHIEVLRRLTRVLGDQEQVARLVKTQNPAEIIEALTGEKPAAPTEEVEVSNFTHSFEAVIHNRTGLHARPATNFVELARQYRSDIRVRCGQQIADGKSLLSLLQLGVESGTTIQVLAVGVDAAEALVALEAAVREGLGDEPEETTVTTPAGQLDWSPASKGVVIDGISAANGLAIGPIRQHERRQLVVEDAPVSDLMLEADRLQAALDAAQRELEKLYQEVKVRVGSGKAAIFKAHSEFLNDPALLQQTIAQIFEGHSAAWAWHSTIQERVGQMQKLDDPVLAARAVDMSDVGERVLGHLLGITTANLSAHDEPVILVADDLKPSDTVLLDPDMVLGFCTACGGPTSHTAIIARSLGIPAIVGAGKAVLDLQDGQHAILDGFNGKLYLNPVEADIASARAAQQQLQQRQEEARASRFAPAQTTDGYRVEIAANINRAADAPKAIEAGAEGVGLMRTEFLFLERASAPSEEEQYEAYSAMVQALNGRPLIIRTLDIGGDKEVPYLNLPAEDNSFLGIRGIRLCLARPDLFVPQLRAIYRAAAFGPIKIMFPMVATLEELAQAKAVAEEVRQSLNAPALEIGIMVEVPSTVLLADFFAQEVDFFSIGTNDLTQYTLAMNRLHPQLARQADALHPAVLRMVARTVQAAEQAGKWVGVCGGVAGDPKGAAILTGLGVKELSVSIPSVPEIKAYLRGQSQAELQKLAQKALQCRTAAEVRAL